MPLEKPTQGRQDFIWTEYEEPHAERKRRMLKKYGPQLNELMGPEPMTKYIVVAVVVLQLVLAFLVPELLDGSWGGVAKYVFITYWVGGTINHNLFLAIHEVTHNSAFRRPLHNDLLAIFGNLPIGLPYAMMFKTYHAEHHRYQGWDGIDTDIPTKIEGVLFQSTLGKLFFAFFQILFYALRPCLVRKQKLHAMHLVNWVVFVGAWYSMTFFLPGQVLNAYLYCLFSTFSAGALHPMSGHFISEHYVFDPHSLQETYSYYGWMNILGWNVGHHNEHHDFPNVPWSRLPQLRKLAPEYYDHLATTDSWAMTVFRFILDPNVGAFSRVKRERGAAKRERLIPTPSKVLAPACEASSL